MLLSQNSFFSIFQGYHQILKRKVILYQMPLLKKYNQEMLLRFKEEQFSVLENDKTGGLQLLEQRDDAKNNWFIYDFFSPAILGKDFSSLPLQNKIHIFHSAVLALHQLHQKKVIHNLLHPGFIFISPRDKYEVRIAGIGLKHLMPYHNLLKTSQKPVFFQYISPESTGLLQRPVDIRGDLYGLGMIFYEFFSGRLPFIAEDTIHLVHQQLSSRPLPLSQVLPECPGTLEKIILKMTEKEPENRYHSALGLIHDLEKLINEPERDFEPASFNPSDKIQFQISLTGRRKELDKLKWMSEKTRKTSQSILIYGKAGIGKTKLVDSFLERLDPGSFFPVKISCSLSEKHIPYFHLKKLVYASLSHFTTGQISKISAPGPLQETAHFFLSQSAGESSPKPLSLLKPLDPEKIFSFLELLWSRLTAMEKIPIFFFDNIQWLDIDSAGILSLCSKELPELPLFFIFTCRTNGLSQDEYPESLLGNTISHLALSALDPDETREFIHKVLNKEASISTQEYQTLYEQTQGEPFSILEWLASLLEQNLLFCDPKGTWKLKPQALKNMPLLPSQQKFLLQRLDIFPPQEKHILALASVVGEEFSLEFLEALLRAEKKLKQSSGTNLIKLIRIMDKARKHQILRLEQRENGPLYRFVHAQLAESLYLHLKKQGKTPYFHQLCAEILEKRFEKGEEKLLYEITYHYNHSKIGEKQRHYNYKAYQKARENFSLKQAAFFLERYLLPQLRHNPIQPTTFEDLFRLISLMQQTGKIQESLPYLKKIQKWAQEENNRGLLQEVYHKLGIYYYYQNENKLARENFLLELKEALKTPEPNKQKLSQAYFSLASAYFFESNYKESLPMYDQALLYMDQQKFPLEYLQIVGMRSWVFLLQGEFDEARQAVLIIERYLAAPTAPPDLLLLSVLYHQISYYYSYSERDPEKALSHALKSHELASQTSFSLFQFSSLCSQLKAYIALRKYDHAIEIGRKAVKMAEREHISISLHLVYAFLIEAFLLTGQFQDAAHIARKALAHPQKLYPKSTILDFYLALALEAQFLGNYAQAENWIQKGYAQFSKHPSPYTGYIILSFYAKISEKNHPARSAMLKKKLEKELQNRPQLFFLVGKSRLILQRLFAKEDSLKIPALPSQELQFKNTLQLEQIIATSQLIASILDIDRLLPAIIQKTLEVTGGQAGYLILLNQHKGTEEEIYYPHSFPIDFSHEFMLKKLSQETKGFVYPGKEDTPRGASGISYLISPLRFENQLKGILILQTTLVRGLFEAADLELLNVFTSQAAISLVNAQKNTIIQKQFGDSIQIITSLIANTSSRLYDYTEKVTELAVKIARKYGLNDSEVEEVRVASLVHDLGLLSFPAIAEKLLVNKQALSAEEETLLTKHPQKSIDIISSLYNIDFIRKIILQHHEHYDGSGYPAGLKKNQITLGARILKLSDDFITFLTSRYFQGKDKQQKLTEHLISQAGKEYDPELVTCLLELIKEPYFFPDAHAEKVFFEEQDSLWIWSSPSNIHYETLLVHELMDKITPYSKDSDLTFSLEYSLSEVIRNAIVHGNHYDENKKITVKMDKTLLPGKLQVEISDEGAGMNIALHQHFSEGRNELFDLIQEFKDLSARPDMQNQPAVKNLGKRLQKFQLSYYSDFNIYRQFHGKELTGGLGLIYVQKVFDKVSFQHRIKDGAIAGTIVSLEKLL